MTSEQVLEPVVEQKQVQTYGNIFCCDRVYRNGGRFQETEEEHVVDCVEHMSRHIGSRIALGFRMLGQYE